jgi:hypothetical protein
VSITTSRPSTLAVLVRAHDALDVGAVAGRRLDHGLGDALEGGRDVGEVAPLPLGDARQHVVVELLHDPDHAVCGGLWCGSIWWSVSAHNWNVQRARLSAS